MTFGLLPTAQNDKFGSRPVAKLALPQKISEPTVQGIKKMTSALPAKIWTPACLLHSLLLRTKPPSSVRALPSGWDCPHLTKK